MDVPPDLLNAYQQYLGWFEAALLAEKVTLRQGLQGRLSVGLRAGNGSWDSVINRLHGELETLGCVPAQAPLTQSLADGHLTPEAFVQIRGILEEEGSESEKQAFYALDYHRSFNVNDRMTEPPYRFDEYGHSYFIPPGLSGQIPLNPPFYRQLPECLHGLFWGKMVAFVFFQHPDCQFLLAQAAAFLRMTPDRSTLRLDGLLHHPSWQQHAMCLNYLLTEHQRAEKWLAYKPWIAFLFPEAVTLLENYQRSVQDSAHQWMRKQLGLLNAVMTSEEAALLNQREKATWLKALEQLEVLQIEWHFSGDVLSELTEITLNSPQLCHPIQPESPSFSHLPVRHQFRQWIRHTVQVFELTATAPIAKLDALKSQLRVEPTRYDSVALRLWLVDSLKEEGLPDELKCGLQTILDQPQFSQETLHHAENSALGELKRQLPETLPPLAENPWAVLEENPWNDEAAALTAHCQAMKKARVGLSDPRSILWQEKFSAYALRFLQSLQNLPSWEAFVSRRAQTSQLLDLLVDLSATHFTALHRVFTHLCAAEKKLSADSWALFKEIYLARPIQSLTACLAVESCSVTVVNLDAVSYESQKVFAFLKPQAMVSQPIEASTLSPIPTL